jgi:NOL1/NOP2/fmu family ribosome biogenesis protein
MVKGKTVIPAHAEALLADFDRSRYPLVELDYATAVSYLRSEAITLPAGTPTGFVAVTFLGQPLGFVKNIGNRANNLYPKEWRIKSTHIPEEYETILRPA